MGFDPGRSKCRQFQATRTIGFDGAIILRFAYCKFDEKEGFTRSINAEYIVS